MQAPYWWWLIALVLGIAEMFTGTFYLLVLALGCLAGGLAAWFTPSVPVAIAVAAVVTLAGWAALRGWSQSRRSNRAGAQADRDVLLDVGQRVRVDHWEPHGRGAARYRGAQWQVELERGAPAAAAQPGDFQIVRLAGNTLIVLPLP